MARLADGDRAVFDAVFRELWPTVRQFTERFLLGAPEHEDAAQATLMRIFERASEYDPRRDAVTWALGIAAYQCRTARRKVYRRREDPAITDGVPNTLASPEEVALKQDLEEAARTVLHGLGKGDVETLLAMAAGIAPSEVPPATFRKRVQRALTRLRAAWSTHYGPS
jgi:RNA polymerase sigma-70 factor (ECF subfamily)